MAEDRITSDRGDPDPESVPPAIERVVENSIETDGTNRRVTFEAAQIDPPIATPDTMQEVVFTEGDGPEESIEFREAPVPSIGSSEVLVENRVAGINYADVNVRQGVYEGCGYRSYEFPCLGGFESGGVVVETGEDVTEFEVGDRVGYINIDGVLREYVTYDTDVPFGPGTGEQAKWIRKLPGRADLVEVQQLLVQATTAYLSLHYWGSVSAGDNLLISAAAGGVGTQLVQLADAADVTTFGTASTEEKLDVCRYLGLDHGIDYTEEDTVEAVREVVGEDGGIDLAVDGVGGRIFKDALELLNPLADVVSLGNASGRPGMVSTPNLVFGGHAVKGAHLFGEALYGSTRPYQRALDDVMGMYLGDELRPIVDREFDVEDIADAHRYIQDRDSIGKVVLRFD